MMELTGCVEICVLMSHVDFVNRHGRVFLVATNFTKKAPERKRKSC